MIEGAQGHSAAVKEAVGAALLGSRAPFRLVQDHSRSGRLEAPSLALRAWLFSDNFAMYLSLVQVGLVQTLNTHSRVDFASQENCAADRHECVYPNPKTLDKYHLAKWRASYPDVRHSLACTSASQSKLVDSTSPFLAAERNTNAGGHRAGHAYFRFPQGGAGRSQQVC